MFRLLEYNALDVQCVSADVPCTQTCIKTVAIDPCTADIGFVCGVSCVMDKHSFIDRSFDQVSIDRLIGDRSDAMCMAYRTRLFYFLNQRCYLRHASTNYATSFMWIGCSRRLG